MRLTFFSDRFQLLGSGAVGTNQSFLYFFCEAKEDKTWTEKMKNDIRKIEMFKVRHFIKDISGCTLKIEYL